MGTWKELPSPKLAIPLELREVTPPGMDGRVWEVQELRKGCVFKATLTGGAMHGRPAGGMPLRRDLTQAEIERAVCLAIEEALLSPPEKEPGATYEVFVTSDHVHEAAELSG